MKKYLFTIIILLLLHQTCFSQAIRKSYLEMTSSEKLEIQNAFYAMRDLDNDGAADPNSDDDDLMNDLGDFHLNYFNFDYTVDPTRLDIHLNLSDWAPASEPEREIFFAWHRAMLFELEQAMQELYPNISLPFWDSTFDGEMSNNDAITHVNSTIFTPDFLGPFNADWSLGRNVGGSSELPTTSDINFAFTKTDFFEFSNEIEREDAHAGAHRWIGGVMPTSASARDPVFYIHHAYIDKLWNDWQIDPSNNSAYHPARVNMLRYDGTYIFHGVTQPSIDPDDLIDSKVYGTFFAENQLAALEGYTVSNTYHNLENFYYQYVISAGNNFSVPNATNCKFESLNEIILTPGFFAETGATFTAKIDTDDDITTSARGGGRESKKGAPNPYDYNPNVQVIAFDENSPTDEVTIIYSFPNPFKDKITLNFSQRVRNCKVEIYNMVGMVIREEIHHNVSKVVFGGLNNIANGTYLLKVTDMDTDKPIITRRFIKL